MNERTVCRDGAAICLACAHGRYYTAIGEARKPTIQATGGIMGLSQGEEHCLLKSWGHPPQFINWAELSLSNGN